LNNLLTIPPLSLYIHYPWCLKKCPYCDFNSHEGEVKTGYINALIEDLEGRFKVCSKQSNRINFYWWWNAKFNEY